jgi:hypothetical protein
MWQRDTGIVSLMLFLCPTDAAATTAVSATCSYVECACRVSTSLLFSPAFSSNCDIHVDECLLGFANGTCGCPVCADNLAYNVQHAVDRHSGYVHHMLGAVVAMLVHSIHGQSEASVEVQSPSRCRRCRRHNLRGGWGCCAATSSACSPTCRRAAPPRTTPGPSSRRPNSRPPTSRMSGSSTSCCSGEMPAGCRAAHNALM